MHINTSDTLIDKHWSGIKLLMLLGLVVRSDKIDILGNGSGMFCKICKSKWLMGAV